MEAKTQDSQLWFQEVIQPKLNQLRVWAEHPSSFAEPELKAFLKEFISELELVQLDDYVVEHHLENILDGARTLKLVVLENPEAQLKELARIAWLKNPLDRFLFLSYWRLYRPFRQKNQDLTDASILNAYWIPRHLQSLVAYVEKSKEATPPVLSSVD